MSIQPFDFQGHEVRVLADNPDNPMWVARDVAIALGYKNPSDAIKRHCKGVAKHDTLQTAGGVQNVRVITEPDLYRLIVGSDLETAQEFERVVFEEVLPSIRKRGGYLTAEAAEQALTDPDFIIRLATELKEERAGRAMAEARASTAEAVLDAAAPALEYHEKFIAEDSDVTTVADFARMYGTTAPKVRELLVEKNIAFRISVGARWSKSRNCMVEEAEWRPRAGRKSFEWLDVRPQHNAPRLHNGQVRQTMYVKTFHAPDLAKSLGLEQKEITEIKETA